MSDGEKIYLPNYHSNFVYKIRAFEARIDTSRAILDGLSRTEEGEGASNGREVIGRSPYFPGNEMTELPIKCSLLTEEAEEYGYQLDESLSNTNTFKTPSQRRGKNLLLVSFEPIMSARYSTGCKRKFATRRGEATSVERVSNNGTSQEDVGMLKLRESLERNLLNSTPFSTRNACKEYLRHPSRQVLNKYAHLFGLKPVLRGGTITSKQQTRTTKQTLEPRNEENVEQTC